METKLKELDIHLKRLRPEYYSNLNEPLKMKEIQNLEERFNVKLPIDLKTLYKWKNGQKDRCYEAFVNNSMFLPLEEALDSATELASMIGSDFEVDNWWNENWIPIFHNGGGDSICYDMSGIFTGQQGQLLEFWHSDNDRNIIVPSLRCFFELINQFYEMKNPADWDEFFIIEHVTGFYKSFRVK